jgi:hypothetical protein
MVNTLQPMALYRDPSTREECPGQWINPPNGAPPVYVMHPEHIKRLTLEGGYPIADPRDGGASVPITPKTSNEAALLAEMERMRAEIERLQAMQTQIDKTWETPGSTSVENEKTGKRR